MIDLTGEVTNTLEVEKWLGKPVAIDIETSLPRLRYTGLLSFKDYLKRVESNRWLAVYQPDKITETFVQMLGCYTEIPIVVYNEKAVGICQGGDVDLMTVDEFIYGPPLSQETQKALITFVGYVAYQTRYTTYKPVRQLLSRLFELFTPLSTLIDLNPSRKDQLDPFWDTIIAVGLTSEDGKEAILLENFEQIVPLLEDVDTTVVFHNGFFDVSYLKAQLGCEVYSVYDTIIPERLMTLGVVGADNRLDAVFARLGVMVDKSLRSAFSSALYLTADLLDYIRGDINLFPIVENQKGRIEEEGIEYVVAVENSLVPVVTDMYLQGVSFDLPLWEEYKERLDKELEDIKAQVAKTLEVGKQPITFDLKYSADRSAYQEQFNVGEDEVYRVAWQHALDLVDETRYYLEELEVDSKEYKAALRHLNRLDELNEYSSNHDIKLAFKDMPDHLRPVTQWVNPYVSTEGDLLINLNSRAQVMEASERMGVTLDSFAANDVEDAYNRAENEPKIFLGHVLSYKDVSKQRSWRYEDYVHGETGKIHPEWNSTGTVTGRSSCSNPNLQQMPAPPKDPNKINFRLLIIPDPVKELGPPITIGDKKYYSDEYLLIRGDYDQQEPRIWGQRTGDEKLIEACQTSDVYASFANILFDREGIVKGDKERDIAKVLVLAAAYGSGAGQLASSTPLSYKEAEHYLALFRETFPTAYQWGIRQKKKVLATGRTSSILGRYRTFDLSRKNLYWHYENVSQNYPVQSTAADQLKISMRKLWEIFKEENLDAHIILQVHDELVIMARARIAEYVGQLMSDTMVESANLLCPEVKFVVNPQIGREWEK